MPRSSTVAELALGALLAFAIALAFAVFTPIKVRAQAFQDPATSSWFKSLYGISQNGSTYSCCDQSDCHPTPAEFIDGHWVARTALGKDGELIAVPPEKVLSGVVSPFARAGVGLAVLCEVAAGSFNGAQVVGSMGTPLLVYCFVIPPTFG